MANMRRDTETSLYLRFHTNPDRRDSVIQTVGKVIGLNPLDHLAGISVDSGELSLIFSLPLTRDTVREDYARIQSIFLRLYDYFPSLSEVPSEPQQGAARDFVRSQHSVRQHQYA